MKIQVIEKFIFTDIYNLVPVQHHSFTEFNKLEDAINFYTDILETNLQNADMLKLEGEIKIVIDSKTALWNDFPVLSKFLSDFNLK